MWHREAAHHINSNSARTDNSLEFRFVILQDWHVMQSNCTAQRHMHVLALRSRQLGFSILEIETRRMPRAQTTVS